MKCSQHDEEMVEVTAYNEKRTTKTTRHICAVCDHSEELRSKHQGERIARLLEDELLGGL